MIKTCNILLSAVTFSTLSLFASSASANDPNFSTCVATEDFSTPYVNTTVKPDNSKYYDNNEIFYTSDVGHGYWCLSRDQIIHDGMSYCNYYGKKTYKEVFEKPYEAVLNQASGQLGGWVPILVYCGH